MLFSSHFSLATNFHVFFFCPFLFYTPCGQRRVLPSQTIQLWSSTDKPQLEEPKAWWFLEHPPGKELVPPPPPQAIYQTIHFNKNQVFFWKMEGWVLLLKKQKVTMFWAFTMGQALSQHFLCVSSSKSSQPSSGRRVFIPILQTRKWKLSNVLKAPPWEVAVEVQPDLGLLLTFPRCLLSTWLHDLQLTRFMAHRTDRPPPSSQNPELFRKQGLQPPVETSCLHKLRLP